MPPRQTIAVILAHRGQSVAQTEHDIAFFAGARAVDHVVAVVGPGGADRVTGAGGAPRRAAARKVHRIAPGGTGRAVRSLLGFEAAGEDPYVLFRDAGHPVTSLDAVRDCVAALADHEAVTTGACLQGFRLSTLVRAYDLAGPDPSFPDADAGEVLRRCLPGVPVHRVAVTTAPVPRPPVPG